MSDSTGIPSMHAMRPRHVNAAYYPSWRVYREHYPSSLSLEPISHLFYAFARTARRQQPLQTGDDWADRELIVDGQKGCLKAAANLRKRSPHLKVCLSIGGGAGSSNFPLVADSAALRERFASTTGDVVQEFDLDGVDIDWEHPASPKDCRNFIALITALRRQLPRPRYLISAALPAGEWALKNLDLVNAQTQLDFINLMTYDFTGPWTPRSGHHAQLFPGRPPSAANSISPPAEEEPSCSRAVQYLIDRGVEPGKIVMGVPVYGRSFLGVDQPGQPHCGHGGEEGTFEYKDLPRPGSKEVVDLKVGAAYCVGSAEGGFITYDMPETVKEKARFALQMRLAGLFYWTVTADRPGPRSLVRAGYNELHK
ncbi:MAG: hypothetical protein M1814_002041 [Vezdaea aestivalis]|nr:MAG: hypothetical protein M1814_002041 [Vezdaea aestivalis]